MLRRVPSATRIGLKTMVLGVAMLLWLTNPACADVRVVTTIKPLTLIVEQVVGEQGRVHTLIEGAASPHEYAMKMSDMRRLHSADLIVWVGPELETFLARTLAQLPAEAKLRSEAIEGLHWPSPEKGHSDHNHARDPHIWLDPRNGRQIAQALATKLAALDPNGATRYRANAAELASQLNRVDERLTERLQALTDRGFAVYHEGYRHFVEHYGLNQLGYVTLGPEQRPGARHLYELRQALADAVCLFIEPYYDTSAARQLAEELNLRLGELDPLGMKQVETYPKLIENMGQAFEACLKP